MTETDDRFARIFRLNVERRSRTAKGKDEGAKTSSKKLPLLLQSDALKAKVAENVERLIVDVRDDAAALAATGAKAWPHDLRARCERWYDLACDGLIDQAAYEPVFAALEAGAASLGLTLRMERRYRTWTPGYVALQIPPALIDQQLEEWLYGPVTSALERTRRWSPAPQPKLMAYADLMMDGEIHPWIDGCSRVSTALVMWIAALHGPRLPLFAPTKDEHYAPMRLGLDAHERYFEACLARADAEVP